MKTKWIIFLLLAATALTAQASTPPPPGPTCSITATITKSTPIKVGQIDTISVDISITKSEQIKAGMTTKPNCANLPNTTLTSVSIWQLDDDQTYTPFQKTLNVGDKIEAKIPLYAEGYGNGGLQDIRVISYNDDTQAPISKTPIVILVPIVVIASGILIFLRIKKHKVS